MEYECEINPETFITVSHGFLLQYFKILNTEQLSIMTFFVTQYLYVIKDELDTSCLHYIPIYMT